MREECRITLYLRQQPTEQELYRYLMRRNKTQRMTLIRNMILTEFRRRQTEEKMSKRRRSSPGPPRATVKPDKALRPQPHTSAPPWTQRVTL